MTSEHPIASAYTGEDFERLATRLFDWTNIDADTYDDAVRALRFAAAQARENVELRRRCDIYAAERDHARGCLQRSTKILSSIHAVCYPEKFQVNGKTYEFRPPSELANEMMQAISDRIRAIPDELDGISKMTQADADKELQWQ